MELNKFQEAEKTVNSLINSNLIDAEKGYWVKSLLYLKTAEIDKSKVILNKIIDNSYYQHIEARKLLEKLSDL